MNEDNPQQSQGTRWQPPPLRPVAGGLSDSSGPFAYVQIQDPFYQSQFEHQAVAEGFRALGPDRLPPAPADRTLKFALVVTDDLYLIQGIKACDRIGPKTAVYAVVPDLEFVIELAAEVGADMAITVPLASWWGR